MELSSSHASFGGEQRFYTHPSSVIGLPMRFSIYLPPPSGRKAPLVVFLAGITATEETFPMKAGAQRIAAKLGLAMLSPDTSPRAANAPGEADAWDFGVGAGFYLDATQEPWSRHWRMESYLMRELLPLAAESFAVDIGRAGIFGHSMGGHGALILALRNPGAFGSLSALAPISSLMHAPWGANALPRYLGDDRAAWSAHDASELMAAQKTAPYADGILVDQGLADKFLTDQLMPERLETACAKVSQPLRLRRHPGYDHGYYFVASFVGDHLRHHARALGA